MYSYDRIIITIDFWEKSVCFIVFCELPLNIDSHFFCVCAFSNTELELLDRTARTNIVDLLCHPKVQANLFAILGKTFIIVQVRLPLTDT